MPPYKLSGTTVVNFSGGHTSAYVENIYMNEVVPTKSLTTQKDNMRELKQLLKFFDDPPAPLEAIEPQHVVQYLRQRGKTAPVHANREKALLSAIWNFAKSSGYTALANPCAGVMGTKSPAVINILRTRCLPWCISTLNSRYGMRWICST